MHSSLCYSLLLSFIASCISYLSVPTKQAGALLFSLSFWTAAALVYDDRVRQSLLISSIGTVILFGSLQITPLQYRVFPPYGLITEAFIPLGSVPPVCWNLYISQTYISRCRTEETILRKV